MLVRTPVAPSFPHPGKPRASAGWDRASMDDLRVGRLVRALRRRRGWRQADLADRAGTSQSVISELERGRLAGVTVGAVRRIGGVLGASTELELRGSEPTRIGSSTRVMPGSLAQPRSCCGRPGGTLDPRPRTRNGVSAVRSTSSAGTKRHDRCSSSRSRASSPRSRRRSASTTRRRVSVRPSRRSGWAGVRRRSAGSSSCRRRGRRVGALPRTQPCWTRPTRSKVARSGPDCSGRPASCPGCCS